MFNSFLNKFNREYLPSIMNTKRTFDEIHLSLPNVTITKQILMKFGENIKKVQIEFSLNEKELIELIALTPNLEEIRFGRNFLLSDSSVSDFVLNSTKLRSINITSRRDLEFFTKVLPLNILENLLVDVSIDVLLMEELLKKQTNIQKIQLRSCYPCIAVMEQLKLTELKLKYIVNDPYSDWDYLKSLLSCQKNLVYLDLWNYRDSMFVPLVNNDIMQIICQMENLEALYINIDGCHAAVPYFSNLKKLKLLYVMSFNLESLVGLDKLSLLENLAIERFVNGIRCFVPAQTYQQMGRNFKKLKHLKIVKNVTHKINFFLENFPNLKSLNLSYGYTETSFAETLDYTGNRTFPNIKNLQIKISNARHGYIHMAYVDNLKRMLPNLTQLQINNMSYF